MSGQGFKSGRQLWLTGFFGLLLLFFLLFFLCYLIKTVFFKQGIFFIVLPFNLTEQITFTPFQAFQL